MISSNMQEVDMQSGWPFAASWQVASFPFCWMFASAVPGKGVMHCRRAAAGHAGLRHVAQALLDGPEAAAKTLRAGRNTAGNGHTFPGAPVCDSAAYLRNRVGVPRDLPLPAARQLRAHLNWLIDELRS